MTRSFTHLHVASGYSLRYGASTPAQLVETAAAQGMDSLALTDRDGLYGAVKFTLACLAAKIQPLLGVDLAVESSGLTARLPAWAEPNRPASRTPARGGASVDPRHPRVTVLALAADPATGLLPGQGWGRLCRLVTATQLRGERGRPVSTLDLVVQHAWAGGWADGGADERADGASADGASVDGPQVDGSQADGSPIGGRPAGGVAALMVLLGPGSEFGRAALAKRPDVARAVLERWRSLLPPDGLAVEIVHHRGPAGTPASRGHAARMLAVAREAGIPAVLTNAVRHSSRDGAVTVDVLDAARRLVPLDNRHLDRTTAEGYLAAPDEMAQRAFEVAEAAGDPAAARDLLAETEAVADRCRLDPQQELGLWETHLPEPRVIGLEPDQDADVELRSWCEGQINNRYPDANLSHLSEVRKRLDDELEMIASMRLPTYFLTIAKVCELIRAMDVRVAARGSGAGSLVNHLLGISGVDPLRYDLLMERFVTPLRAQLPDIDLDVESDRRTDVYEKILDTFGGDRVTCVSMMDTYRVRHAIRDVGAALGLPPGETDTIAKSFPHIRARDVRHAIAELPELRASGLAESRLDLLFDLVERLDGLPRHVALHPCGVVISDGNLLDRTPVEASWLGFPMSQFDKDDVEAMGLLKLDVLGIRMQSAMSYAIKEIARVDGPDAARSGRHPESARYLDATGQIDLDAVPLDDEATYKLIQTTRTLGCFQIESPGQRELVGKFGPETFHDLIIDISLFRPGPVKSDMVNPFLRARKGWDEAEYLHPWLVPVLESTCGVVVFHEQVLQIVAATTGCSLAQADEVRRAMGSPVGQDQVQKWFRPKALARGVDAPSVDRIWEVLKAFASFGFCKAHAAAFALPTYQSAWLKAHHPAAFLAGVLTHDPGMYPKRLILDDARNFGISVLPLDVNYSDEVYRVERVDEDPTPQGWGEPERDRPYSAGPYSAAGLATESAVGLSAASSAVASDSTGDLVVAPASGRSAVSAVESDLMDGRGYGIRLSLAEVKGINDAEVARVVANRPYHSLADFWHRARVSRPVVERLVVAGGFDSIYGLTEALPIPARDRITRRDLLLQLADLERWTRSTEGRAATGRAVKGRARGGRAGRGSGAGARGAGVRGADDARVHGAGANGVRGDGAGGGGVGADGMRTGGRGDGGRGGTRIDGVWVDGVRADGGVRGAAARQSQAARPIVPVELQSVQLALDLDDAPDQTILSGLPEMTSAERVRAELEVLGLDASRHVLDFYAPLLEALGVTRARDVRDRRSRAELLVAGVKVATQTPPIRTGRRVVFLTLDDSTGPVDATFFEDAQGPYATTVFHSWLLVVRGVLRKTGAQGVSLRATGAWELPVLWDIWTESGLAGVQAMLAEGDPADGTGRRRRPSVAGLPTTNFNGGVVPADAGSAPAGKVLGVNRDDGALPDRDQPDWEVATGLPSGDRVAASRPPAITPAAAGAGAARSAAAATTAGTTARTTAAATGTAAGRVAGTAAGRTAGRVAGTAAGRTAGRAEMEAAEVEAAAVEGAAETAGEPMDRPHRRVLVHASGYRQSPYADLKPPGDDTRETRRMLAAEDLAAKEARRREPPRKLWHASPGSSGR